MVDPDPLPSWRCGAARRAILDFVARVTAPDSPDLVPVPYRVAVFDNDDTLWCERPAYPQALFMLERLAAMARADPALAGQPVVRSLLAGDLEGARSVGMSAMLDVLLSIHAGLTAEEFTAITRDWFGQARHPRLGVPFGATTYLPMVELLDLLRASGFRVFVVTGGGVEFVRAASLELYGVPPDDVVGSAVVVDLERRDGRMVLVRRAALLGDPNEGAPKPLAIQAHIGVRPILAAGNSAGDREMLEYASSGPLPSLALVVDHDDGVREYAYAVSSFTDPGAEPILDTARRLGWTTVSMRDDWDAVFSPATS